MQADVAREIVVRLEGDGLAAIYCSECSPVPMELRSILSRHFYKHAAPTELGWLNGTERKMKSELSKSCRNNLKFLFVFCG